MRTKLRITLVVVLLVGAASVLFPTSASAVPSRAMPPERIRAHRHQPNYAWQLFRDTNASRRHNGLPTLRRNRELTDLVEQHSRAMARSHNLFHTTRVGRYLSHVGRWHAWGENIGWTGGSLDGLHRAFMRSYEHRANILSRNFHHVALGVVRVGGKLWATVFFYG